MTPAEQIVAMMIEDGLAPARAAEYAAVIKAMILVEIKEREPVFLHTR